jgi:hypothetical protein
VSLTAAASCGTLRRGFGRPGKMPVEAKSIRFHLSLRGGNSRNPHRGAARPGVVLVSRSHLIRGSSRFLPEKIVVACLPQSLLQFRLLLISGAKRGVTSWPFAYRAKQMQQ